jgi:hypothetical protein
MSGEVMADVGESSCLTQNYLESKINEIIGNYSLGVYEKWAVIAIILDKHGPHYPEVFRNHNLHIPQNDIDDLRKVVNMFV